MMLIILLAIGLGGTLLLAFAAFQGPSPQKALKRRMELLKERHADGVLVANANAQIRKLLAARESRVESMASALIPKPALLRKRLEQTGKQIGLGQYALISLGLLAFIAALAMFKGLPWYLALILGAFVALSVPHWVIGRMIKKRLAKFTANFPDAIELMVRGLRSGLPITETMGIVGAEVAGPVGDRISIGVGQDEDRPHDGGRAAGNRRPPRHARIPVLRHHARDPARDRRQSGRDALEPRRRASQARADEAQDPGDELGIQGVGVDRRRPAVHRLRPVYVMNPAYMGKFFIDQRLIVAGLGGMCWMGCGAFIMAKMVNFEI